MLKIEPVTITRAELEKVKALPRDVLEAISAEKDTAALEAVMKYLRESNRMTVTENEAGYFHDKALQAAIYSRIYGADREKHPKALTPIEPASPEECARVEERVREYHENPDGFKPWAEVRLT